MTTRRDFLKRTGMLAAATLLPRFSFGQTSQRPNILWLSCEDISPHLGCYGYKNAMTPHLDQLAKDGIRYTSAFTTAGVCAPCRSGIITSMYQTTLGTHHMRCRAKLPDFVKGFPQFLRENGYYCCNNAKTDYQTNDLKNVWDDSSGKAHWRNRQPGQPFFAVFNYTGTHESGVFSVGKYTAMTKNLSQNQRQKPDNLDLPPYYPDTPMVREDQKRYYELITAMDQWAGNLIGQLQRDLLLDDTIIFFWSDHGAGLPRSKRWTYDSGTHIPLIVHIPEKFRALNQGKPGTVDDQMITSLDFGPTTLNLASVMIPNYMQGQPFLGFNLPEPRQEIYSARDRMDGRYDLIRSVRDKKFRYIRNFEPSKPYLQYIDYAENNATRQEIRRLMAEDKLPPASHAHFAAAKKPVEELYDLENDPHEIKNLADDPSYKTQLTAMRKKLRSWMLETRDMGLIPEGIILEREEKLGNRYAITHQPGSEAELDILLDLADIINQGPAVLPQLEKALQDKRDTVRYWASLGIGNMGQQAEKSEFSLYKLLLDPSATVRVAAAEALCNTGKTDKGWKTLVDHLSDDNMAVRLYAITVIEQQGEKAREITPLLRKLANDRSQGYVSQIANHILNSLNIPVKKPNPADEKPENTSEKNQEIQKKAVE